MKSCRIQGELVSLLTSSVKSPCYAERSELVRCPAYITATITKYQSRARVPMTISCVWATGFPVLSFPSLSYPILCYPFPSFPKVFSPVISFPFFSFLILFFPFHPFPNLSFSIPSVPHLHFPSLSYPFLPVPSLTFTSLP